MEEKYRRASDVFSVLSHQPRLRILDELRRGEACVCHLQAVLGRPQAYVSQQLGVLRDAGVVTDRRDGLFVYYGLADAQVEHLLQESLGPASEPTAVAGCPCPHCDEESRLKRD
ncbi:MAG: metalloregulator ArsR/SmtB family transcription factor [Anaerolineae bacterium]|jgi:ArsR family transcriptional regulator